MINFILGFLLAYSIICYLIALVTVYTVFAEDGVYAKMNGTQVRTMIALFLAAPLTVPAIGWELRTKPEQ